MVFWAMNRLFNIGKPVHLIEIKWFQSADKARRLKWILGDGKAYLFFSRPSNWRC